jgi:hypothetical protein
MDKAVSPTRVIGYMVGGGAMISLTSLALIGVVFPEVQGGILRFAMLLVGSLGVLAAAALVGVAATSAVRRQLSN